MKPLSLGSSDRTLLATLLVLGLACALSLTLVPRIASANVVTFTSVTATSSPVYTNTGLATTSVARTGDSVRFQLTISANPSATTSPVINIQGMGTTSMSNGGVGKYNYSTTTSSAWSTGAVQFYMAFGGTGGESTTTISQTSVTAPNVTIDNTSPTLNSIAWTDVDSSKQFSGADTLLFTFSETMATTTISSSNIDTVLGLTNSHTFGTTAHSLALAWNTPGTILTLTLGGDTTVTGADTVDPTAAVLDAIGNADATLAAVTLPDTTAPSSPTGLADTTFSGSVVVSLVSTGSTRIRYTTDGTTPSCSVGTLYTPSLTVSDSITLKAIGCDEAGNASSVVTATYTHSGNGGSSGGGSSVRPTMPTMPTIPLGGSATSAAVHTFMLNLTMGALGAEVKALQIFLNAHGYVVAASGPGSSGNETTTLGSRTRAALIRYQKAKHITPAVGYFGPMTRAAVNADS